MQNLISFWKKSVGVPRISALHTLFFFVLCLCEPFYRLGFVIYFWWRGRSQKSFSFPVFSVGNLSVGGTGKSVVVSFLADALGDGGAIVTRGYGRSLAGSKNYLINNYKKLIVPQSEAGDEPAMFVLRHGLPVVVGSDRLRSLDLVQAWYFERGQKISFAILDDAYQNPSVRKECEILLIDARRPFENGHALPAGLLREKDYTRADLIILTHADKVSEERLQSIVKNDLKKFKENYIFYGKHVPTKLKKTDGTALSLEFLNDRKIAAAAGIGNFSGFASTLQICGAIIVQSFEFVDHHAYTKDEIEKIIHECTELGITSLVTTAKDWPKLFPLLEWGREKRVSLYVLEVEFAFLTDEHHQRFMNEIRK